VPETSVGAVKGDLTIDSDGGANYSIPIPCPSGRRGQTPSIGVAYNSAAGNDLLGVGWTLRGFSTVARVPATVAQDGFTGTVNFDSGDRFALDGARLIAVEGQEGAPGSVYRTEIDGWKKIVPVFGAVPAKGPQSFQVYDRNGTLFEYGAALPGPGGVVRAWGLSRIKDLAGNSQTFVYDVDVADGMLYPLRAEYSAGSVRVEYGSRADVVTKYVGGLPVRLSRRVSRITAYLENTLVAEYRFAYETGAVTGSSRLVSVTQAGSKGGTLTPTRFTWQEGDPNLFGESVTLPATGAPQGGMLLPMDFNGDGVVDLVQARSNSGKLELILYLARFGGGFAAPQTVATELAWSEHLFPMDFNGDGCIDLIHVLSNRGTMEITALAAKNRGGKWTLEPGPKGAAGPADLGAGLVYSMDVDGDGLPDLVHIRDDRGKQTLTTLFSNGTRFDRDRADKTAPFSLPPGAWIPCDFNGDGMADLVHASRSAGKLQLTALTSHGRAGFTQGAGFEAPLGTGMLIPMDVNGDGKTDLVNVSYNRGKIELTPLLSNGHAFEARPTEIPQLPEAANNAMLMPADLKGDGMTDLVLAYSKADGTVSLGALLSNGTTFTFREIRTQPLRSVKWAQLIPLDIDGDGRTDLLHAGIGPNGSLEFRQVLVRGERPDLLKSIVNGLGGKHEIVYDTMTNPALYSKDRHDKAGPEVRGIETQALLNAAVSGSSYFVSGPAAGTATPGATYATRNTAFPRQMVRSYKRTTGSGPVAEYRYFYRAGRLDVTGRGWLGFEVQQMTDVEFDAVTLTEYHQGFPLERSLSQVTIRRASDNQVAQSMRYTQEAHPTSRKTWHVRETEVEARFFHWGGAQPDAVRRRTSAYDAWGNVTRLSDSGTGVGAAATHSVETFSQPDLRLWVLGRRVESKLCADAAGDQKMRWRKYKYDDRGFLTQASVWNDRGNLWLNTGYEYDAWGNRVAETVPSGAVTKTTYDDKFHAYPVRVESARNQSGRSIVSKFEFDATTGDQSKRYQSRLDNDTSPGAVVFERKFDEFGRPFEEWGPDPSGTLTPLLRRSWANRDGICQETQTRADWSGSAWHWERVYLDGEARPWRTEVQGHEGRRPVITEKKLDGRGNPIEETRPFYYKGDLPFTIRRRYDALGRLESESSPLGTTRYERPSALTEETIEGYGTPEARRMTVRYILCGDEILTAERTNAGETTKFQYDALGQVMSATDPAGIVSDVKRDSLGRQIRTSVRGKSGVSIERTFEYDDAKRTQKCTGPDGKWELVESDGLDRRWRQSDSGGSAVEFVYDVSENGVGLLGEAKDPKGASYRYAYDRNGNQARTEAVIEGEPYVFERTYGPSGQPLTLRYPDGSVQNYAYNGAHELASVSLGALRASFGGFTAAGKPSEINLGNKVVEKRAYGDDGRLRSQVISDAAGTICVNQAFEWNPMGQLSRILDRVVGAGERRFGYEASGRLKSAREDAVETAYSYDAAGNMTAKGGVKYEYDGYKVKRGTQNEIEVFSAEYDNDGQLTRARRGSETRTFQYDSAGNLAASEGVKFTYDYKGRRLTKQVAGGPLTIYVSPSYEVVRFPNRQTQSTLYMFSEHGLLAAVTKPGKPPEGPTETPVGIPALGSFYFHSDYNGNIIAQTSESGAVVASVKYDPYGKATVNGPDHLRHKFGGKEFDRETGLYYFEARYYDPETGRFTTADSQLGGPEQCRDSFNRYAYVVNDPLNLNDPTGHSWAGFKQFWTDVADWFESDTGQKVLAGFAAGMLLIGGIALTILAPPAGASLLGFGIALLTGTVLGAGIAGSVYVGTVIAEGDRVKWNEFGIQLGIGAATGFVTAGISAGTATILHRGAQAALAAADAVPSIAWGVSGWAKITVTIVGATIEATAGSVVARYLENLAEGRTGADSAHGLGAAATFGAIFGFAGAAAGQGVARRFAQGGPARIGYQAFEESVMPTLSSKAAAGVTAAASFVTGLKAPVFGDYLETALW